MSTVGLKLGSLLIKTISKPIATAIKAQARDHPTFRRICISLAQSVHRADMRLRLGLLRDAATIEKLEAAERAARLAAKEKAATAAAASSEASSAVASSSAEGAVTKARAPVAHVEGFAAAPTSSSSSTGPATLFSTRGTTYHIRPLSETKAIDRGAAFISEAFLFAVAGSLILFESIRSRRKENNRQDIIAERLDLLEERNRQDEERILWLEEKVWRLEGRKGPARNIQALPLWEGGEVKEPWWRRILPEKWSQNTAEEEDPARPSTAVASSSSAPSSPPTPTSSSTPSSSAKPSPSKGERPLDPNPAILA
ncbi:optic atrophy 3 protein-domain-containing protein [Peziza echinospora]|nr:optic atrophy 3 protein-domain-containing protein [Peziza echinospora]